MVSNVLIEKMRLIKVLGVNFSYNQKLQKKIEKSITNMQQDLNLQRMRNITLEVKIIIFKTLALSRIVYLTVIASISKQLIEEIQKIKNVFIWNKLTPKIKHEILLTLLKKVTSKILT